MWHQAAHITVLSETAAPLAKAELIRLHMCTTGLERGVFNRKRRVSIHPGCSLAWIKYNSFPQLLAHKGPWFTLSTFSSHPKLCNTSELYRDIFQHKSNERPQILTPQEMCSACHLHPGCSHGVDTDAP